MRCPKCTAAVPRTSIFFPTALHAFECEHCGAMLQASYLSRVALLGLALFGSLAVAGGLRAVGAGRMLGLVGLVVSFLGLYFVGSGFIPRLRIQIERPGSRPDPGGPGGRQLDRR
jgi:hypothetical protein